MGNLPVPFSLSLPSRTRQWNALEIGLRRPNALSLSLSLALSNERIVLIAMWRARKQYPRSNKNCTEAAKSIGSLPPNLDTTE